MKRFTLPSFVFACIVVFGACSFAQDYECDCDCNIDLDQEWTPAQRTESQALAVRTGQVSDLAKRNMSRTPLFAVQVTQEVGITKGERDELFKVVVPHPVDVIATVGGYDRNDVSAFYELPEKQFQRDLKGLKAEMQDSERRQIAAVQNILGRQRFAKLQNLHFDAKLEQAPFEALLALGISPTDDEFRRIRKVIFEKRTTRDAYKKKLLATFKEIYGSRLRVKDSSVTSVPMQHNAIDSLRFFGGVHPRLRTAILPPHAKCEECFKVLGAADAGYRMGRHSFHEKCFNEAILRNRENATAKTGSRRRQD